MIFKTDNTKNVTMIKIKITVPKLLLPNNSKMKDNNQVLDLEYPEPVTVERLLTDNRIDTRFLGLIILNGTKNVDKKYLIKESCKIKLFLLMGGG